METLFWSLACVLLVGVNVVTWVWVFTVAREARRDRYDRGLVNHCMAQQKLIVQQSRVIQEQQAALAQLEGKAAAISARLNGQW